LSTEAAEQAANYAKREAPKLLKEQVLPLIMKQVGADNPGDIAKQGIGLVGDQLKDAGGLTGLAGKMLSKVKGGGKGGGAATGYGVKRRMPIQQDVFVSVSVEDAYKGWTEYKRWTEFMFRVNQVDSQIEDEEEGEARVKVTEKMWMFKRPFTALVESQIPNEHIRWKSTDGTKHVGTIAFHELGDRLTLISVNVDHAPSGPIEKIARGARFDKRAIRADLHRFKGWIEMKSPEDIEEIEGWFGTIESGKITQTHEEYLDEQEEQGDGQEDGEGQAGAGEEDQDAEGTRQGRRRSGRRGQEDPEGGSEGDEEDEEEGGELDEDDTEADTDDEFEDEEEDDSEADTEEDFEDEEEEEEPDAEEEDADANADETPTSLSSLPKRKAAKKRAKKPAKKPAARRRTRSSK
jgi:uncharacterized membrane protein